MRRRIYVEHLPAELLEAPATLDLLHRYRLEPIVALPPSRQTPSMAKALAALDARGLRLGVWPLLDDADGYWPSDHNAPAYRRRVDEVLAFCDACGANVRTVAVDLEPPLEELRAVFETVMPNARGLRALPSRVASGFEALREHKKARRPDATAIFADIAARLADREVETIAAMIPLLVLDLEAQRTVWQDILQTPVTDVPWSALSPMLYSTIIAQLLPTKSHADASALVHVGAARLRSTIGRRASVSLGLVGVGKLGSEPAYATLGQLADDVGAARSAGVDDLALFALEGVLARERPEAWLDAFVSAPARRPSPWRRARAEALVLAARAVTAVGGLA